MSELIQASDLKGLIGQELEPSEWVEITQERIDRFADATNDHQFIHVDPESAAKTPFGGTIAHGFLTLSLIPYLVEQHRPKVANTVMGLNYGLDKLRFLQAVPVGSRIRARQKITQVKQKNPGQWLINTHVIIDIENTEKPALIADQLSMLIIK